MKYSHIRSMDGLLHVLVPVKRMKKRGSLHKSVLPHLLDVIFPMGDPLPMVGDFHSPCCRFSLP